MSFGELLNKKEVRFSGSKKFVPDPGKYICEIQDTIETKFNEKSGITSIVMDFKTIKSLDEGNDPSNLNITMRMYIPNGINVAVRKLKAVIAFSGQSKYFDEVYEDVPAMDNEKWPQFFTDVKSKLSFRTIGVEVGNREDKGKTYADFCAFFPVQEPKQVRVSATQEDFTWEE